MARKNKSRFAILGILNRGPCSGYDLKTIFNRFAPFHWNESNAQIYPILKALEKEGMLRSKVDPKSGGRKRRLYQITASGKKTLNAWLAEPVETPKYREEMLIKLANSYHLPKETSLEHLQEYLLDIEYKQKLLARAINHLETDHAGRPDQQNLLLTYGFSTHVLKAKKEWALDAIKTLNKQK